MAYAAERNRYAKLEEKAFAGQEPDADVDHFHLGYAVVRRGEGFASDAEVDEFVATLSRKRQKS